jgi:hypothetical protein
MLNPSPESQSTEEILKILDSQKMQFKDVIESPILYASRQTITKVLTRIKLFEKILDVQGSIVECGVYKADSLMTYFHLSNIYEPFSFTRKIIGFDTFEGFPHISEKDVGPSSTMGHLNDVNYELIRLIIVAQEKNKAIPSINKIELIKGDAIKTIPDYISRNSHLIISLLYLDFDLYEPTKIALEHLLPRVPVGGIVGFDELNQSKWGGETQALNDVLQIGKVRLKKFEFDPHVSYFERVV